LGWDVESPEDVLFEGNISVNYKETKKYPDYALRLDEETALIIEVGSVHETVSIVHLINFCFNPISKFNT
jgi:predicted type IV restriction endonuclease